MAKPVPDERPVTTSIYLEQSKLDKYAYIALRQKFNSRNSLIASVLSDWLDDYEKENGEVK